MKVIIDTNVLISAVLRNKDPETVLVFVAAQPDIEWIVSPAIMAETKRCSPGRSSGCLTVSC